MTDVHAEVNCYNWPILAYTRRWCTGMRDWKKMLTGSTTPFLPNPHTVFAQHFSISFPHYLAVWKRLRGTVYTDLPKRLCARVPPLLGSLRNYDGDHNDSIRFNDQNNSSAGASRFLVHFFDVHCTTTTWNLLIWRFMEDVDIRRRIFLHLFEPE